MKNQVLYDGRWVDKKYFRVFVYKENEQKLVNSYDEYEKLIKSGEWFSSKDEIGKKPIRRTRKSKNGSNS